MSIDIRHLAWLARLSLSADEAEELRARLRAAKKLVDRLLAAPVEEVEPLYHPHGREGILREDRAEPGLDREKALLNAARVEDGYIVGPRTVED